jgi:nitronate monooxygenase
MFLRDDASSQIGTFALVPLIVDAVEVPVIAAGGIAHGRSIAAAFALGASGVQIGTAYLATPEATISAEHRDAIRASSERGTALTNVFTGRPARSVLNRLIEELGPIATEAPQFPLAGSSIAPLREHAEALDSFDFSPLWSGQAGSLGRELPAADLTRKLWSEALSAVAALNSQ